MLVRVSDLDKLIDVLLCLKCSTGYLYGLYVAISFSKNIQYKLSMPGKFAETYT